MLGHSFDPRSGRCVRCGLYQRDVESEGVWCGQPLPPRIARHEMVDGSCRVCGLSEAALQRLGHREGRFVCRPERHIPVESFDWV